MSKSKKTVIPIPADEWFEKNANSEDEKNKLRKIKMLSKIASELIGYRIKNHMTQGDLAKKLGVSQNQISKWESGTNDFKVGTLTEIATKLGLNLKVDLGLLKTEDEFPRKESTKRSWKSNGNSKVSVFPNSKFEGKILNA